MRFFRASTMNLSVVFTYFHPAVHAPRSARSWAFALCMRNQKELLSCKHDESLSDSSCALLIAFTQKCSPSTALHCLSRTSISYYPRCHLVSRFVPCTLRNTCIFPATDVCPHVAEYSAEAFPCALCGPFGNLHLDPALSLPDSLCAHHCFDLRFIGLLV